MTPADVSAVLAYAFGPLFLGPLSELYGRVPVLQLANLFFLVFNLVCGFAQTGTQLIVSANSPVTFPQYTDSIGRSCDSSLVLADLLLLPSVVAF